MAALIAAIIAFLEPYIEQWLADLFTKLQAKIGATATPADASVAVHDVFAAARAELGWWSFLRGRFAVLAICERITLTRAAALVAVAKTGSGTVPPMSGAEREAIKGA